MKKIRIDTLLVEREIVESRSRAVAFIMAGHVFVGGKRVEKAGQMVAADEEIEIRGQDHPYVSRGGVKLAHALKSFGVVARDKTCMDVGASTGGFTDCLLQEGAKAVYAIDVGYGQLALKLVRDKRVVVIERTNIRTMEPDRIPDAIELVVVDVSFISLVLVLPVIDLFLVSGASIIALIKPQFEVGRELVGKGGIVRDPASHELAVKKVSDVGTKIGWVYLGVVDSPILGAKGNKEFLVYFQKP